MSVNKQHNLQRHVSKMLFALQSVMLSEQQNWLLSALGEISKCHADETKTINRIISYTAMARRVLGESPMSLTLPVYEADQAELNVSHWSVADLARIVLVGTGLVCAGDRTLDMLRQILRFSDNSEKKSIYLGVYWLIDDDSLVEVLVDAQRTNALDLFAAITQQNPVTQKYFDEPAFNQLVLKSLFQSLAIDRIIGLQQRRNAELMRMCDDYLHERRLADREIPASLWLVLSSDKLSKQTLDAWKAALTSQKEEQRYYAMSALHLCHERGESIPVELLDCWNAQLQAEQHPSIRRLVQDMQSQKN